MNSEEFSLFNKKVKKGVDNIKRKIKLSDVKCPYFRRFTSCVIFCENVNIHSKNVSQGFGNEFEKNLFMRENCCKIEPCCEIYRLLNSKYEV